MCPNAIGRSNRYAEKEGLPRYEYVLHPRVTGFIHFVKEMKKGLLFSKIFHTHFHKNGVFKNFHLHTNGVVKDFHTHTNEIFFKI